MRRGIFLKVILALGGVSVYAGTGITPHSNNRLDIYTAVNYPIVKAAMTASKTATPNVVGLEPSVTKPAAVAVAPVSTGLQPAVMPSPFSSTSYNPEGTTNISRLMQANYNQMYAWPSYASPIPGGVLPYYSNPIPYGAGYGGSSYGYGNGRGAPMNPNQMLMNAALGSMLGSGSSGPCSPTNTPQTNTCEAVSPDQNLIQQLKTAGPPAGCNIPKTPQKEVFGFAGLDSYYLYQGIIRGMVGKTSGVDFHYYSWDDQDTSGGENTSQMTDVLRCAYAEATTPYVGPNGGTVYSSMTIVGHSFGGEGARDLAVMLAKAGVTVDNLVTADARDPSTTINDNQPNWSRPCNVARYDNYWEPNGLLRGFQIPGAHNIEICGEDHLDIPSDQLLINNTQEAMNHMPVCKQSFANSNFSSVACNTATARAPAQSYDEAYDPQTVD